MEPSAELTIEQIVDFAFSRFIEERKSEMAENFTETAIFQIEQLHQLIRDRLLRIPEAESIMTAIENGSDSGLQSVVEYLKVQMDQDQLFAYGVWVLAYQINAGYILNSFVNERTRTKPKTSRTKPKTDREIIKRKFLPTTRKSFVTLRKTVTKPEIHLVEIPVFFATDRNPTGNTSPKDFFGGQRNQTGDLEFGLVKVSIPAAHRMGHLEKPNWWKFEFSEDPTKHVMVLDIKTFRQEQFLSNLRDSLKKSEAPDLLVFIHGYNTSFEDAARRTAQIAYDLNFPGQAILYSWPSAANFLQYTVDENNIEWTIPHLRQFLNLLLTATKARAVNAIAHSMGNRALARVVKELDHSQLPEKSAILRHIVFAAPDIDADTFRQFAKQFHNKAERFTLYASSRDKALLASKVVHGYPRAGDSGEKLVIVDGVDSIDASQVDTDLLGHSYFGDNRSILSDIFYLIQQNLAPDNRAGLISRTLNNLRFWRFKL